MRSRLPLLLGLPVVAAVLVGAGPAGAQDPPAPPGPSLTSRAAAPIVITGAQLPSWTRSAATGVAAPYTPPDGSGGVRSAHNGTLAVPPDARTGADVDQVSAWAWSPGGWVEVPVQVDQRYPYFLTNARSDFGIYSGTDQELTYAWAPDAHNAGEEAWKKFFGTCRARYANAAEAAASPLITPGGVAGTGETRASYTSALPDPVATLDDDDEVALQARDAGPTAPVGTLAPAGTTVGGHTVAVVDPAGVAPTRYLYLFLKPVGGSAFSHANSEVQHIRDATADDFIDRASFTDDDPEKLASSNTGYGPNMPGTICPDPDNDLVTRDAADRFPRDGVTIATPSYRLYAIGRWMVRDYSVAKPGQPGVYGDDLIDRWKGRAFQQSPDSTISLVGFEDEQVNWEANAGLLGWRAGAVRVIREIWGADSGTNVTKTETYYRDADVYRYRVRVHPIPSDGLYTSWDYNPGAAALYYTPQKPEGVPIDGINDENTGNFDGDPIFNTPAFFDACDPTFDICAVQRPEQVAGAGDRGGVVYVFELVGPTSALNPSAVPYYRDDACLDDGTGDAPVPRPWPGEASTDNRVKDGYVDYWKAHGAPSDLVYADLVCDPANTDPGVPEWKKRPFQGAFASHGIHFFVTGDTDNIAIGTPATEIDGQQWRYAVPMAAPRNASVEYGANVIAPLRALTAPYGEDPEAVVPEVPWAPLLPVAGIAIATALVMRSRSRRRRPSGSWNVL